MRGQALVALLGERCETSDLHVSTCAHCTGDEAWFEEKPTRTEVYGE